MLILSPKNIVSPFIESAFAPLSLWFSGSLCQYAYRQPYLTPPTLPWETCSWRFFEKQGRRKHPVGTRAGFATEKARNTPNNGALRAFFRHNLRARSERMRYSLELLRSNKQASRFSENEWLTDEKAICQSAAYSSWLHHIPAPSHSTGWESMSYNKSWVALSGALTKSGVIAELERSKTSTLSFFRDIFQQPSHYLFYYIMCNFFTLSFNSLRLPTSSSNGTDSP